MIQQALNNPNTNYTINAIVREVGDIKYTEEKGTPFQRIVLDDGQIQQHIKIWQGKGQALNQSHIGQRLQFRIKGYVSTYDNNTYLSGFWNANAQTNQPQGRQLPPQQTRQGAAQQNNEQRDMRIVRGNAVNAVFSATEVPLDKVESYLSRAVQYILTGNFRLATDSTNEPDPDIQEPPTGDDIPF